MDWNNINTDKDTSGLGPIEYDQSKVPSLIRKHADNVRGKSYGQDVREAQARNAEYAGLVASESKRLADNADYIAKDTQSRFDRQIAGSTYDNETIDARGDFDILGHRFNFNELNARPFRNVEAYGVRAGTGDDVQDQINSLEEGFHYIFPKGVYSIRGQTDGVADGMKPKSNTSYEFKPGAALKIIPNGSASYNGILLENVQDFEVINPVIIGDRNEHDFSSGGTHERGAGMMVRDNAKGRVHNLTAINCTGDGLDVIGNSGTNVEFIGNTFVDESRRNGVSLESAHRLIFDYLEIANTNGTSPESGLDFEPFKDGHILDYVYIKKLKTSNSNKIGMHFAALQWYKTPVNIVIDDAEIDGLDFENIWDSGNDNIKITINNPKITSRGIISKDAWTYKTVINSPDIESSTGQAILISSSNYTGTSKVGGLEINDVKAKADTLIDFTFTNGSRTKGMQDIKINTKDNQTQLPINMGLSTDYAPNLKNVSVGDIPNNEIAHPVGTNATEFLLGQKVTNKGATARRFYYIQSVQNVSLDAYLEFEVEEYQEMFISTGALSTGRHMRPGKMTSIKSNEVGSYLKLKPVGSKYGGQNEWQIVEMIGNWEPVYE